MWALLPLKNFADAKQRLSGVLTAEQRRNLFQAMVEDVLTVLQNCSAIANTVIVADDPLAGQLARDYGADYLAEAALRARGLNAAVQAATAQLAGCGIDELMVVHGDLPLISTAEVDCLVRTHRGLRAPALTIAPDQRRRGSNCLLCSQASQLRYGYGSGSFARHAAQAGRRGMSLQVVTLPGIGFDIDTPQDLLTLLQRANRQNAPHTWRYIGNSTLGEQLAAIDAAYSRAS